MATPPSEGAISADDEWLPDADALATVLALLRRHRLGGVEQLLLSELEVRAEAATRAVAAWSASSRADGDGVDHLGPGAVASDSRSAPVHTPSARANLTRTRALLLS